MTVKSYDFCLAWNWEHDADFVMFIERACHSLGLSLLQITPDNLPEIKECLDINRLNFRAFFDRASDTDTKFIPVCQWAHDNNVYCINPRDRAVRTWNKAAMHYVFIENGINTPHTIVIPSYEEQPDLPPMELNCLGDRFIIKPAHGGGGDGVIREAASLSQMLVARQEYPADRYMLQTFIVPADIDSRPAWFRVISCAGKAYLCWWPPDTQVFTPISVEEESQYFLTPLRNITETIARICKLELFSTEIALTDDGLFIVVDYVNDQIDLRLKSKVADGVPDDIVYDIAVRLAGLVVDHCSASQNTDSDLTLNCSDR